MMRVGLLLVLVACTEQGSRPEPQVMEVVDQGQACLLPEGASPGFTSFVAGERVNVQVNSFTCLSSSCTAEQMASCEVRLSGTTLTITTHASWIDTSSMGQGCTDDCSSPSADCQTPPLPAGNYTVRLGPNAASLQVPSMPVSVPCVGGAFDL